MSDLTTRSLDRVARTEAQRPGELDSDKGKSKAATLGSRSVNEQGVAPSRVGDATKLPPPPSSDTLVVKQPPKKPPRGIPRNPPRNPPGNPPGNSQSALSARIGGAKKIVSQYDVLRPVDGRDNATRDNATMDPRKNLRAAYQRFGGFSSASGANPTYGSPPTARDTSGWEVIPGGVRSGANPTYGSPPTARDTSGYEVAPGVRSGAGRAPSGAGTSAAPPLPLRPNDFLSDGGVDLQAVKQREGRENLYLAANRAFAGGTSLTDRQARSSEPSAPRFSATQKFLQNVKRLFTRSAHVPRREISSEKSRFGEEVTIRGINQRLSKKDLARVAKLGKDIDSVINKGRQKGEITPRQHALIAQKNEAIEKVFKMHAQAQGGAVHESPTYDIVDDDYARRGSS